MSRQQNQGKEYVILQNARFHELCAVLGLKDQCCSDPNKKVIEKAFRKKALKTHPDKGGDQKEFKKVNDAYNRLLGHITKLEIANEESEMSSNSIIIEVSKISLPKWRDKLKNKYGTPKCENVKGTLFEGPYKQYRGRSNNTGPITIVMYEDPQDGVPKLLIRAEKYMAWIAEQMMPLHLHVDKGRSIKFDQWRICHLAEFGFTSFSTKSYSNPSAATATPTPQPKRSEEAPKTKEEKAEAKEARKKARREAEKKKEEEADEKNKDNSEPQKKEPFSHKIFEEAGKDVDDGEEWEEVPEDPNDPFPKLYNMAEQGYVKDGKRYRKKAKNVETASNVENKAFTCGSCGVGYTNLLDYQHHKKVCVPDEDFGQADYANEDPVIEKKNYENIDTHKKEQDVREGSVRSKDEPDTMPDFNFLTGNKMRAPKPPGAPLFECDGCGAGYDKLVAYTKHKAQCPSNDGEKTPNNDNKSGGNDNKSVSSNNKANEQTNRIFATNTGANITNEHVEDNASNAKKDLCKSAPPSDCETLNMTHSKQRQTTEERHVTPNDDSQGSTGQTGLQNKNLPFECKFEQKLTNDQNASEEMSQDKLHVMQDAHDGDELTCKETPGDYHSTKLTVDKEHAIKMTKSDEIPSKSILERNYVNGAHFAAETKDKNMEEFGYKNNMNNPVDPVEPDYRSIEENNNENNTNDTLEAEDKNIEETNSENGTEDSVATTSENIIEPKSECDIKAQVLTKNTRNKETNIENDINNQVETKDTNIMETNSENGYQDPVETKDTIIKETNFDNGIKDSVETKEENYDKNIFETGDKNGNDNQSTDETQDTNIEDNPIEPHDISDRQVLWGGVLVSEDELCADVDLFSRRWPRLDATVLEVNWQMYREGIKARRDQTKSTTMKA